MTKTIKHVIATIALAILCTSPLAAEHWRFIVTSDSQGIDNGINLTIASEIAEQVVRHSVDFLLFPGDLVTGYTTLGPAGFQQELQAWSEAMWPVYNAGIPIYAGRGNHELSDVWLYADSDPNDNYAIRWLEIFGNRFRPMQRLPDNGPAGEKFMTYAVTHKNALIIMLDQYAGIAHYPIHRINQDWLDDRLSSNTKPHVFVTGHESAFRTYHTDCLDNFPKQRDAYWTSLQNAGVRACFSGHDHYYDHALVDDGDGNPDNDIHQCITATCGGSSYYWYPPYSGNNSHYSIEQLYHAKIFGYMLVDIHDMNVNMTFFARDTSDTSIPGIYAPIHTWIYTTTAGPRILSPNSSESLIAGAAYAINWKTIEPANIKRVALDYSLDNGQTWNPITTTPNTGSCIWQTPYTYSTQCIIRIADASNPQSYDTSDRTFTITQCATFPPGDINHDCTVNFLDFLTIAQNWLTTADQP